MSEYMRDLRNQLIEKLKKEKIWPNYALAAKKVGLSYATMYKFLTANTELREHNAETLKLYLANQHVKNDETPQSLCDFSNEICKQIAVQALFNDTVAKLPEGLRSLISFQDFKNEISQDYLLNRNLVKFHVCHLKLVGTKSQHSAHIDNEFIDKINEFYCRFYTEHGILLSLKTIVNTAFTIGFKPENQEELLKVASELVSRKVTDESL